MENNKPISSIIRHQKKMNKKMNNIKKQKKVTIRFTKNMAKIPSVHLDIIWRFIPNKVKHPIIYPKFRNIVSEYLPVNKIYDDSYLDITIISKCKLVKMLCEIPLNKINYFMKHGYPQLIIINIDGNIMNLNTYSYRLRNMYRYYIKTYYRLSSRSRLLFLIEILSSDFKYRIPELLNPLLYLIHAIKYMHETFADNNKYLFLESNNIVHF